MDSNSIYKTSHHRLFKSQLCLAINFGTSYIYKIANRSRYKHFKCCKFILFCLQAFKRKKKKKPSLLRALH